jgi:hypothetical protein
MAMPPSARHQSTLNTPQFDHAPWSNWAEDTVIEHPERHCYPKCLDEHLPPPAETQFGLRIRRSVDRLPFRGSTITVTSGIPVAVAVYGRMTDGRPPLSVVDGCLDVPRRSHGMPGLQESPPGPGRSARP